MSRTAENFPAQLLVFAAYLAICLSSPLRRSVQGNEIVIPNNSSHQECEELLKAPPSENTCNFYSSCIESRLPCGITGFALGYAEQRCNMLMKMDTFDRQLSTNTLSEWMFDHEMCLRSKIMALLPQNASADGPTCLHFETAAFQAFKECNNETSDKFCSFNNTNQEAVLRDVLLLTEVFSLNDSYYTHTIDRGFVQLLDKCNESHTRNVSSHLVSQYPRRVVICAWHSELDTGFYKRYNKNEYIRNVSIHLEIPKSELVYGGIELLAETKECFRESPSYVKSGSSRVHVILWSVPPTTEVRYSELDGYHYYGFSSLEYWPAERYTKSGECGDGVRQATEMCDSGVDSGVNFGCSADCQALDGFECYSAPLQESKCISITCGDGRRSSNEECDDGDLEDGDGCSSLCTIESGWQCGNGTWVKTTCTKVPPPPPPPPSPSPPMTTTTTTTSDETTSQMSTTTSFSQTVSYTDTIVPSIGPIPDSSQTTSAKLMVILTAVAVALLFSSGLSSAVLNSLISSNCKETEDERITTCRTDSVSHPLSSSLTDLRERDSPLQSMIQSVQ